MWAEQAIFTSLTRRGRAGYHVVARSPGLSEPDLTVLSAWSPSHGALIVDGSNRTSVNVHPMPGGRLALSRTCEGPAEYSGRGGRQLYTHALIVEPKALKPAAHHPLLFYRAVLAQGQVHFQTDPPPCLDPVRLPTTFAVRGATYWDERAGTRGRPALEALAARLAAGETVQFAHKGDRTALAECLIGLLPPEARLAISVATSLLPSAVRPFRLVMIGLGIEK